MRKWRNLLIGAICISMLTFVGCGKTGTTTKSESNVQSSENSDILNMTVEEIANIKDNDKYTDWKDTSYTTIQLNGDSVEIKGDGASVDGTKVTITAAGTYLLQGTLKDGQVLVDAGKEDVVRMILNGVEITSQSSAAFDGVQAKKVVFSMEEGTTNTFTDAKEYENNGGEDALSAAIYSTVDLTFNGTGTLVVNGNYNNGIQTKDNLKILEGTYEVTSADDAIVGRDRAAIMGGTFTLKAGGDGIKSTNAEKGIIAIKDGTFNITATAKGINSETSLVIEGGTFDIVCYEGSSNGSTHNEMEHFQGRWGKDGNMTYENEANDEADNDTNPADKAKGLMANNYMVIRGGSYKLNTANDAVHCNDIIYITGGDLEIASGDDGIHADNQLTMEDGTIKVTTSYEGLESTEIYINGGEYNICASDDGINAAGGETQNSNMGGMAESAGYLYINGGKGYVNAGGDGLDANTSLKMTDGYVLVEGPENSGNGALDYGDTCEVTGGTLIALGSSGMMQTISDTSTINCLAVVYSSQQAAGTTVALKDADGKSIVEYQTTKNYESIVIASPELKHGATYTLYSDDNKLTDVTLSGILTNITDSGETTTISDGMGGFGGGMKGGRGGMNPGGKKGNDGQRPDMGNMPNQGDAPQEQESNGNNVM